MDIKQLYYFTTVVQKKTISAAAKKLHISQPPLSTALKQLETELCATLFIRGKREIQITESGKYLYEKAMSIIDTYEAIISKFSEDSDLVTGSIKIGMVSSSTTVFLDKIIMDFHKEFPEIRFEIIEGNTHDLFELLNTHALDVALLRTPFPENNMKQITIQSEHMVAIADAQYLGHIAEDSIPLAALANYPLIVYRRWLELLKNEFEAQNVSPYFICINDDARTTRSWIERKMGVGIVPASSLLLDHSSNIIHKKISNFDLNTDIVCLFGETHAQSQVVQLLYDYMKDTFL